MIALANGAGNHPAPPVSLVLERLDPTDAHDVHTAMKLYGNVQTRRNALQDAFKAGRCPLSRSLLAISCDGCQNHHQGHNTDAKFELARLRTEEIAFQQFFHLARAK